MSYSERISMTKYLRIHTHASKIIPGETYDTYTLICPLCHHELPLPDHMETITHSCGLRMKIAGNSITIYPKN